MLKNFLKRIQKQYVKDSENMIENCLKRIYKHYTKFGHTKNLLKLA